MNRPIRTCLLILGLLVAPVLYGQETPNSTEELKTAPAPQVELPGIEDTPATAPTSKTEPVAEPAPEPVTAPTDDTVTEATAPEAESLPEPAPPREEPDPKLTDVWREQNTINQTEQAESGEPVESEASGSETDRTIKKSLVKAIASLCIIIGIIWTLAWLARKYGKKTPFFAGQHLGQVMGKVHLSPKASIHFVKTGDRVLLIGLTQDHISLLTEFNAQAFVDSQQDQEQETEPAAQAQRPNDFLAELRNSAATLDEAPSEQPQADDDLELLKGDIQRLQAYLKGSARDTQ